VEEKEGKREGGKSSASFLKDLCVIHFIFKVKRDK